METETVVTICILLISFCCCRWRANSNNLVLALMEVPPPPERARRERRVLYPDQDDRKVAPLNHYEGESHSATPFPSRSDLLNGGDR